MTQPSNQPLALLETLSEVQITGMLVDACTKAGRPLSGEECDQELLAAQARHTLKQYLQERLMPEIIEYQELIDGETEAYHAHSLTSAKLALESEARYLEAQLGPGLEAEV